MATKIALTDPQHDIHSRCQELKRAGFYVEPLLKHESLHADDAERLCEWGLSYLEAEMIGAANLPAEVVAAHISEQSSLVALTVGIINVVMGEKDAPEPPTEKQLRLMLSELLQNIYALTGSRTNPFQVKRAIHIAKNYTNMASDYLFAELFAMLENTRTSELTNPSSTG